MITKTCPSCGESFRCAPYLLKLNKGIYCSRRCFFNHYVFPSGSAHPGWRSFTFVCMQCGVSFTRVKRKSKKKFCSHTCYNNWLRKNVPKGSDSMTWNGGSDGYRGPTWKRQSRRARVRDKYTCQSCGAVEQSLQQKLHVHHIMPYHSFRSAKKANYLSNLISFCKACHAKEERHTQRMPRQMLLPLFRSPH